MNMMNSSDWEEGGPETDCRGVEMTQHCHRKGLLAIASVALLAGTLMLSNHEALARGDGGFGGGHEGSFGGVGFHGSAFGGGFGGGHNRIGGFGARGFSHLAGGHEFDHRGQVGDPYWTPCNYYSYGVDSCSD
jgi:hypothetical protein